MMKKVLLLLAKGFETYEASVFIDVLGWNLSEEGSTELFSCGLSREIKGSFNFSVNADYLIDEIQAAGFDALAIPGGFEEYGFYKDSYNENFLNLIRDFNDKRKIIASVCTGALPVGKSGILKGRKGTTYNLMNGLRQRQLSGFGVDVINEPVVIDDNIITCRNPSAAIEVGFKLLELFTTKERSEYIKRLMGFI